MPKAVLQPVTLQTLAQYYELTLVGAGDQIIQRMTHLSLVTSAADLVYAPSTKALAAMPNTPARCALTGADVEIPAELRNNPDYSFLVSARDKVALAQLLQHFETPAFVEPGIHATAVIHPTATLSDDVTVGPYVTIGADASIGQGSTLHAHVSIGAEAVVGCDCLLHAGVRIGDRVRLGDRVICQPNAVIGSDGFSYVTEHASRHETGSGGSKAIQPQIRIPSVGTVVLEDDVEVGANTCIDRATLAETRIAKGTKIDNLVQIGHNNRVGQHCLVVSQVGLAGSCKVGDGAVLAGQAGFADHLTIGDRAIVLAKSGVMQDVEPDSIVGGSPAQPRRQIIESLLYISRLKDMNKELKSLSRELQTLRSQLEANNAPSQLEVTAP